MRALLVDFNATTEGGNVRLLFSQRHGYTNSARDLLTLGERVLLVDDQDDPPLVVEGEVVREGDTFCVRPHFDTGKWIQVYDQQGRAAAFGLGMLHGAWIKLEAVARERVYLDEFRGDCMGLAALGCGHLHRWDDRWGERPRRCASCLDRARADILRDLDAMRSDAKNKGRQA